MREKPREPKLQFQRFQNAWNMERINSVYKKSLQFLSQAYTEFVHDSETLSNWKQYRYQNLGLEKHSQTDSYVQNQLYLLKPRKIKQLGWEGQDIYLKEKSYNRSPFNSYCKNQSTEQLFKYISQYLVGSNHMLKNNASFIEIDTEDA